MMHRRWLSLWCLTIGAASSLAVGCNKSQPTKDENKSASHEKKEDAGALPSGVDPDIAAAVTQIAKSPPGAANGEKAPPPNGVFPPGQGDKEIAAGTPPRLTLGNAGSAPKVTLRPVSFESKRDATASLSIRTGPRAALPSLDFVVSFTTSAPKTEGAVGNQPQAAPGMSDILARVTTSKLSAEQPGRLPPGLEKAAKSLEGSRILYQVPAGGGVANLRVEPKPGAEEGLVRVLQSFAEFLPAVHGPYPNEPVGAGAYWMIASRETMAGVDTVTYRMVRVEQVDGTKAVLSVGTKRYAAGTTVALEGIPPHSIEQFQCEGNGRVTVDSTTGAADATLDEAVLAALAPKQDPTKRMSLQLQASGELTLGPAGR